MQCGTRTRTSGQALAQSCRPRRPCAPRAQQTPPRAAVPEGTVRFACPANPSRRRGHARSASPRQLRRRRRMAALRGAWALRAPCASRAAHLIFSSRCSSVKSCAAMPPLRSVMAAWRAGERGERGSPGRRTSAFAGGGQGAACGPPALRGPPRRACGPQAWRASAAQADGRCGWGAGAHLPCSQPRELGLQPQARCAKSVPKRQTQRLVKQALQWPRRLGLLAEPGTLSRVEEPFHRVNWALWPIGGAVGP